MRETKRRATERAPESPIDPAVCKQLQRRLLAWYDRHRRDLPWRRRGDDAYAQLLAEFMLQQTQVATVIPYFERFISRFPTIQALAAGDRDEVLALWSGLGYYSRARNLHETAKQIVARFEGRVPAGVEELTSLPGIGRYTAGAIASVAYDRRAPILDGNVTRVLMRLLAIDHDPKAPALRERLWRVAEEILPARRCGAFNQALMELGATICSPQSPQCLLCPLQETCAAHRNGLTDRIPPPRQRTRVQSLDVVVAAIECDGRLLFTQRPDDGLWGGLWALPSEPITGGEDHGPVRKRLLASLQLPCRLGNRAMAPITRTLTHRHVTFHTYRGSVPRLDILGSRSLPHRWLAPAELCTIGLSRACQAILDQLAFT